MVKEIEKEVKKRQEIIYSKVKANMKEIENFEGVELAKNEKDNTILLVIHSDEEERIIKLAKYRAIIDVQMWERAFDYFTKKTV